MTEPLSIHVEPWSRCDFFNDDMRSRALHNHVYWCRDKRKMCTVYVLFHESSPMAPDMNVLEIVLDMDRELYVLKARANLDLDLMKDALRFSVKERQTRENHFLYIMGIPDWVLDPPCRKITGRKRHGLPLVSSKGKLRAGNNVSMYSFKAT